MAEEMELQEDLLIEILMRLPVKSLIRFTCVCKYWLSLIKSPEFAMKQYATRLSLKSRNEHDCFLASFFPACSISVFCYENMAFETAFKIRPAVAAYRPPHFDINHRDIITNCLICGPCNGLFLLRIMKGLYNRRVVLLLWNPATREVFKLRVPEKNFDHGSMDVGLGFDHVANDYKVVFFNGHDAKSSLVQLYSLAANYWRQVDTGLYIEVMKKMVNSEHTSLSLSSNGCKTHFISIERMNGVKYSLASFDMVDEVFVETTLPEELATGHLCFGGFLYQGSNNHAYPTIYGAGLTPVGQHTFEMHIWVLNGGYGPTGIWNKKQSIMLPNSIGGTQVMLWNDTEIVSWGPGLNEIANKQQSIMLPDSIGGSQVMLSNNPKIMSWGMNDIITAYNFTTQQIKSLQIPVDGQHIIGYTENVLSIASFVRQLPPVDHSSVEVEIGPRGYQQQDYSPLSPGELQSLLDLSSVETQANSDEEDDDDSSTDSAFLMPQEPYILECGTVYIDNEADMKFYWPRRDECQRLYKLPYCLREVNQPLISNPCIF